MNLQNYFLIAMPSMQDPLFKQSVIYLCEHSADGAMGLIINKPVKYTIEHILNNLKIKLTNQNPTIKLNKPIFSGGPLADDRGFILHTPCNKKFGSSIDISSETMITTSKDVLETLGTNNQPKNILIALGYSGWIKGQLEYELMNNSWLTVPANTDIIFNTPIIEKWYKAAKILGIDIRNITDQSGHA